MPNLMTFPFICQRGLAPLHQVTHYKSIVKFCAPGRSFSLGSRLVVTCRGLGTGSRFCLLAKHRSAIRILHARRAGVLLQRPAFAPLNLVRRVGFEPTKTEVK